MLFRINFRNKIQARLGRFWLNTKQTPESVTYTFAQNGEQDMESIAQGMRFHLSTPASVFMGAHLADTISLAYGPGRDCNFHSESLHAAAVGDKSA